MLDKSGLLVTKEGDLVLGEHGPIRLKKNNFVVDEDGVVWQNALLAPDDQRLVSREENQWDKLERVDRLKIVRFEQNRYLRKMGNSFWSATEHSGPAEIADGESRPKVRQGFLEGSNVNPVTEMVQMIEVQRTYEANQKVIQTEDSITGRLINEAVRV